MIKKRYDILGETLVKTFNSRFFESYYCSTKEDACTQALKLINEGDTVSWGGSVSAVQCGIIDKVKNGNYTVVDRALAKDAEEKDELMHKAFFVDTYIMSANAVSQSGELVNVDGNGNRVAALCYGPKQVIVIVSLNKVMPDLDSAIKRARSVAAPTNAQRFGLDTPCAKTGQCFNCTNPDCICADIVITRISRPKNRIKIIFCGEDMGY